MRISTKGRYALRMMLDIALHGQDGPVRVRDIAERQNISVKYLEQIISVLTKAGYLRSVRGPMGGYRLSREPAEYTVGMILRLTEGDMAPVACVADTAECPMSAECITIRLWRELDEAIDSVIDKYTLQDLMSWAKKPEAQD